jgi:hypothetical protein
MMISGFPLIDLYISYLISSIRYGLEGKEPI